MCSPVASEIDYGGFARSQATVFLASYTRKSQERSGKKANDHWLINHPHVCDRKLEVRMRMHTYSCNMPTYSYGMHTLYI